MIVKYISGDLREKLTAKEGLARLIPLGKYLTRFACKILCFLFVNSVKLH